MPALFKSFLKKLQHLYQRKWLMVSIFIVVGLLIGWLLRDTEASVVHATAVVQRGNIENLVTATGTLQPRDYVDVGAQVSGQLKVLHVEVGSEVKQGDLLAEIDATVYLAKVDAIRAQLRNQRAQLLDREAQLKLAQVNYTRQQNLQKEDATTQEALQSAEASLQSAKAQIEALLAQIEQIESSLRAEEANLEFARIYAPMDGTVVSITSRQGQTLNTNQMAPTLLRIADLSTMTVQAQVSEADISKLQNNMKVYFTTLGGEGRRWYSQLGRIEPTPTVLNNVVLYNALFDVPNPNGLLMTQMTTQVFFVAAEARDVLLVPMSALNFSAPRLPPAVREGKPAGERAAERPDRPARRSAQASGPRTATVKVINAKGITEDRDVQVGVTNRVQAEILAGLEEGEHVITGTQQTAKAPADNARPWGPRMMR
jgi:membrane fusion protein, macrolide-specific efflux system